MTDDMVIRRLVTHSRNLMLALGVERNSCIMTCRVVSDALAYFGIHAKPVPCRATAFCEDANLAFVTATDGDSDPLSGGGNWSGHLVLMAAGLLIDPSADQMARPDDGLHVGLLVAPCDGLPAVFADDGHGVKIQYEPLADASWRSAPAWQPDWLSRKLAGYAVRQTRMELLAGP